MASCSVFTIITILLYARHYVHANTIIADSTGQYNHGTINCASNEDCTVICNATSSCYFADINCPANYACNIQCISVSDTIGRETCKTAKFNCGSSAECHILCQGDHDQAYTCMQSTFNWPTNNQYSLTCSGGLSCYGITIDAPNNNEEFTFNCTGNGEGTCFQSTINCPTNADCNINCIGRYACFSLDVQCPMSADSQCNVNCIGLESCQYSKFTGNGRMISCTGEQSCLDAILPTPPPNENLHIHCSDTKSCYGANITCPTNADCILTCTGEDACYGVSITWPVNNSYTTSIICDTQQACNNLADPPSGPKVIGLTTTTTTTKVNYTTTETTTQNYGDESKIVIRFDLIVANNISITDVANTLNNTANKYLEQLIAYQTVYKLNVDVIVLGYHPEKTVTVNITIINLDDDYNIDSAALLNQSRHDLKIEYQNDVVLTKVTVIDKRVKDKVEEAKSLYQLITICIALFCILIATISLIDGKCCRKSDFYSITNVLSAMFHILDTISDIFFSLQLQYHYALTEDPTLLYLFFASIVFILLPVAVSIIQLNKAINTRWTKMDNEVLTVFCRNNHMFLVLASFVCGSSFAAVQLARSNMFGFKLFLMPLDAIPFMVFMTKRIYSINLLENIPQIIIQIIYIYLTAKKEITDPVVYLSMLFSIISVIGALLSMCGQKKLLDVEQYTEIKFDVVGKSVSAANSNLVNKLRHKIAALLRVDYSLVEITRPVPIRNGFEMKINLFVKNDKSVSIQVETLLDEAQKSGELAEYMVEVWKLQSTPNIVNINCRLIESHKEQNVFQRIRASVTNRNDVIQVVNMSNLPSITDDTKSP